MTDLRRLLSINAAAMLDHATLTDRGRSILTDLLKFYNEHIENDSSVDTSFLRPVHAHKAHDILVSDLLARLPADHVRNPPREREVFFIDCAVEPAVAYVGFPSIPEEEIQALIFEVPLTEEAARQPRLKQVTPRDFNNAINNQVKKISMSAYGDSVDRVQNVLQGVPTDCHGREAKVFHARNEPNLIRMYVGYDPIPEQDISPRIFMVIIPNGHTVPFDGYREIQNEHIIAKILAGEAP